MEVLTYRAPEIYSRVGGVATEKHGGIEVWILDVGVATWRNGSSKILEARYRNSDMEVWRYGVWEVWRRVVRVATWTHGGIELGGLLRKA